MYSQRVYHLPITNAPIELSTAAASYLLHVMHPMNNASLISIRPLDRRMSFCIFTTSTCDGDVHRNLRTTEIDLAHYAWALRSIHEEALARKLAYTAFYVQILQSEPSAGATFPDVWRQARIRKTFKRIRGVGISYCQCCQWTTSLRAHWWAGWAFSLSRHQKCDIAVWSTTTANTNWFSSIESA